MFRARRHPLTTLFVVAAYLASITLSGLPHEHGSHAAGCHDARDHDAADHAAANHGHSRAHCGAGESGVAACDATHGDAHDDECVVCRFAGQRVMPAEIGRLDHLSDLGVELAVAHARGPAISIARTTHSRAPPVFG